MRGELSAVEAALFDVVLLGIGTDAHIASLFPDSPLLGQSATHVELAAGVFVPALGQWRITLTPPALLSARTIVVLAAGSGKGEAVAAAIQGKSESHRYPAQLLRAAGDGVEWILDEAAAQRLA